MRTLMVLMVLTSQCFAAVGWIDSSGALVSVADKPGSPPAGLTEIPIELTGEAARPSLLFDNMGNCLYSATKDGKATKLVTPRPPIGVEPRKMAMAKLLQEWDGLESASIPLREWQADTELAAAWDRSAELDRILARMAEIKTAITGK